MRKMSIPQAWEDHGVERILVHEGMMERSHQLGVLHIHTSLL
jgi:hypothetical protein